jgi:hypothetical protein
MLQIWKLSSLSVVKKEAFTSPYSLLDSSRSTNSNSWAKSHGAHPGGVAPATGTSRNGGLKNGKIKITQLLLQVPLGTEN